MPTKLDERLKSAVPYLKKGGRIADVGPDHAYLPIYLVENGISSFAVASDLRAGPLEHAEANVKAAGLSDKIELVLCDGLTLIEPYRPDDILLFGMGGELIVSILDAAPWVKNEAIGLVLQPMSHPEILRAYLLEKGFAILGESLSFADRIYQTIYARFGAKDKTPYTEVELLIGRHNLAEKSPLLRPLLLREIDILNRVIAGKQNASDPDTAKEQTLLRQLNEELEKHNENK